MCTCENTIGSFELSVAAVERTGGLLSAPVCVPSVF